MRTAAARDANEPAIVQALRRAGCLVQFLFQGEGIPDLLAWSPFLQKLVLLEVKDPAKPPSARKLTTDQVAWHALWKGAPVFVVETVMDALRVCGVPEKKARARIRVKVKAA